MYHVWLSPYDGYSETDRTDAAQDYHLVLLSTSPPASPLMYI